MLRAYEDVNLINISGTYVLVNEHKIVLQASNTAHTLFGVSPIEISGIYIKVISHKLGLLVFETLQDSLLLLPD